MSTKIMTTESSYTEEITQTRFLKKLKRLINQTIANK